jgi:hypothetical protein
MPGHDTAPVPGVIPEGAHIHRWRLGLKQSSLGHIVRALRHPALDASRRPPLPWHALVPFWFPVQVSQATQEHSSEFLLTASGIRRSASRRTPSGHLSMHWAPAIPWKREHFPLASISGAVIELSLAHTGGDVVGATWADAKELPGGPPSTSIDPAAEPPEPLRGSPGHSPFAVGAVRIAPEASGWCYSGKTR